MAGPGVVVGHGRALRAAALVFLSAILASLTPAAFGQSPEFRAVWVDAFHAGFKSASEVTTLINNVRRANCNAVVVEVRKRGDAYYTPDITYADYEPHATDTSPAAFDSLADLIAKAHDTSGGKQRIEVHAWLVTWPIWGSQSAPSDPQHPYNRHPEWLTRNESGGTWNGSQYCFDPGHPAAANHTFRIALNLVTNYALDGINFDYVRYAGNTWGYNPAAVSRFRARYGGSGNPAPADPLWLQFRRDQITAFMRKVYLHTLAHKPQVKVSADTITWAPGPGSLAEWQNTAAYKNVLQDWRAWLEEGILDLNIPMAYFDQSGPYTQDWTNWCNFTRDHQYQRHAVIGPGIYLNGTADALTQIRYTRTASPAGSFARGVCGYSYAVPDKAGTSFSTFAGYLTNSPNAFDGQSPGVFAAPAAVPPMPWKTSPTTGHLMGVIYGGSPGTNLDGASITVAGPVSRAQTSDGTGFYGFVDLPPGQYELRATAPGLGAVTNTITIQSGAVRTFNVTVPGTDTTPPRLSGIQATNVTDSSATIAWITDEAADSAVDYGTATGYGLSASSSSSTLSHAVEISGLLPNTAYHFRVRSRDPGGNTAVSVDFTFSTSPAGVVDDIVIDNPAALAMGTWSTGSSATERYGTDYRYKSAGSGEAYLQYTPNLLRAGNYEVHEWHSAGANRTTNAPYAVRHAGGTHTVRVNQEILGGRWNLVGTYYFQAGSAGFVRVQDDFADAGQVVIADAIKFVHVPPAPLPLITAAPQSRAGAPGGSARFSVTAQSPTTLRYQWKFNGTELPGRVDAMLELTDLSLDDFGWYAVLVSNDAGTVESNPAQLTLAAAPVLAVRLAAGNNALALAFQTEQGPDYSVEFAPAPGSAQWSVLTNVAGNGQMAQVFDPASTHTSRVYRVRLK